MRTFAKKPTVIPGRASDPHVHSASGTQPATPLSRSAAGELEPGFAPIGSPRIAHDFSRIPIRSSWQSEPQEIVLDSQLPDSEGVLAATLDGVIHVSRDASRLSKPGFQRLIAHETVHVAQQHLPGPAGTRSQLEHEARVLEPLVLANRPFRPLIPALPATVLRDELTIGTDAADQQLWVSRVDDVVRNRFGLTGVRTRLTDRNAVNFQDIPTFAAGFGRTPRDLLIEVFAENLGDLSARIKDFYNVYGSLDPAEQQLDTERFVDAHVHSGFQYWNYHALDWTDYGLTGITYPSPYSSLERVSGSPDLVNATLLHSATRAQAEAAARREPQMRYEVADGRNWPADPQQTQLVNFHLQVPLSRVTSQINAGELLARTYAGVTSSGARGSRRIRMRSDAGQPAQPARSSQPPTAPIPAQPANVSTPVHEACHFYTHDNFNRFVDGVRSARTPHSSPTTLTSTSTARLAPILQEGFTEYFTRTVMREQASTLGSTGAGAYQDQHEGARLIIENMTPPQAAEAAYFHGNAADIQKVRDGIQFVEQNPNTVRILQGMGLDEVERALEQVRTPTPPNPRDSERLRPRGLEDIGGR